MSAPEQARPTIPEALGRYQLLAKLGAGGMGAVYLAHDTKLDRRVAVKLLPPHAVNDPDAVARFQREAKALAKLSHPGIVQAYDSDEANGRHFLVMEHVEGTDLRTLLREKGRVAPTLAADYAHQAALALQHAHDKGLVHRDLKPGNLLLTPHGQVKLLDLGLARFLQDQIGDASQTREGVGMGTPDYAAPEQFRDAHNVDARADIYSLGCTLYHLLTGRVPFPGSSLSEKRAAHERQEPAPVEELCPEVPGGLALVVARMMAKRLEDRFQTAAEAADALAPYVAGSSVSFARLRNTATWDRGAVTVSQIPTARRWSVLPWAIAGVAVAALVLLAMVAWPRLFPRPEEPIDPTQIAGNGSEAGNTKKAADNPKGKAGPQGSPPAEGAKDREGDQKAPAPGAKQEFAGLPADPDVLTVSKDAKDGGKYRTISEALKEVRPFQTIRILDSGTYEEALSLVGKSAFEGITLEAPRHATLVVPEDSRIGVVISDAPGVTLRGLAIRGHKGTYAPVVATRHSGGLLLDGLDLQGPIHGMSLEALSLGKEGPPVVVRNCRLHAAGGAGVRVSGSDENGKPLPCRCMVVRENRFEACIIGVLVRGDVEQVQIVANRFQGTGQSAIQLQDLDPATKDVLVANNTFLDCSLAFRLWDTEVHGKNVRLVNNLVLGATGPDMVFLRGRGDRNQTLGPGDGSLLHKHWVIARNWREVRRSDGESLAEKAWVPPGKEDHREEKIMVRSRHAADADFLRPPKGSALATEGAGQTDPSLPSYVGAVPPEGVAPWDWERTWLAPPPGKLITVSKDPKAKADFDSIGAALASNELGPWTTIRVLDAGTYAESIRLDDPDRHQGLVLESPRRATIQLTARDPQALLIQGVSHVQVRGFAFRELGARRGSAFILAGGHSAGTVLEKLEMLATGLVHGVRIINVSNGPKEEPFVVRGCSVRVPADGITVVGVRRLGQQEITCQGVAVRGNWVWESQYRGILLEGAVARVEVSGNLVWSCRNAGIQIQDPARESHHLLIANNTAFGSIGAFRIWCNQPDQPFDQERVELLNNLFFEGADYDMGLVVAGEKETAFSSPTLLRAFAKSWRFDHNGRDRSGNPEAHLPSGRGDVELRPAMLLSRESGHADFMRPHSDSPLARGGAGANGPWLPTYIGAVPPRGAEPWDWRRTWDARMRPAGGPAKGEKKDGSP